MAQQRWQIMSKYQCPCCGYIYNEQQGDEFEGFDAGTEWVAIPEDWSCPSCSVRDKVDFIKIEDEK